MRLRNREGWGVNCEGDWFTVRELLTYYRSTDYNSFFGLVSFCNKLDSQIYVLISTFSTLCLS